MSQSDSKKEEKDYSLSKKSKKERGISFSLRENPTIRSQEKESENKIPWNSLSQKSKSKLGTWRATAICGNDITSSCLYVAAISATYAGAYAPICLLIVAGVLFLYRKIYAEVGDALPLNGGAYNCLLNSTTKAKASIAACMTVLSYVATAVISAKTSIEYIHVIFTGLDVLMGTVAILGIFAVLTIIGIGESAKTALVIFITHLVVLAILIVGGIIYMTSNPDILISNWQLPPPGESLAKSLFFGFSVALLGVSGFESSSNFIEEQKQGVFPKTLKNMWWAVTVLNPLIALIAIGVLPLYVVVESKKALLTVVAETALGKWMVWLIAIDAALVLSGAVLASFVGVTGLINRMALDRCMPQSLLKMNSRGTNHRIVIMFFLLCLSILYITGGDLFTLSGVYTISFLGVMCLFAVGNILLKVRRSKLPRNYRAGWIGIFTALIMTISGILGNIIIKPEYLRYFSLYFFPTVSLVLITLYRHHILKFILIVINESMKNVEMTHKKIQDAVKRKIEEIHSMGIIFFTKGDDVASLNRALLYVQENEITRKVTVIHLLDGMSKPPPRLVSDLKLLDEIYPDITIELVVKNGKFSPEMINSLSKEFSIPPNYMFVGTPGNHFPHHLSSLGGVRVII